MALHLHHLRIVEGDLYEAGHSEDGEPVVAFSMWIEAADRQGRIWVHDYLEPGHVIVEYEDWSGPIPNMAAKSRINTLYTRMTEAMGYGPYLAADPTHWVLAAYRPGLEERLETEAEIESMCRANPNYLPPSGYSDLAAWA